jgi:A/G-specific adenine glycosylase
MQTLGLTMITAPARLQKPTATNDLERMLLRWWDQHRRVLPWRALPGHAADPYAVWLSEIMLQQTTVAAVVGFFNKFITRWPTIEALAKAPLEEVLAAWAGLGYYARARNLHACAQEVADLYGGCFPQSEAELLRLPGVGPYTAAAIAAIAFDRACVAQDGNVERVISRLFAVEEPLPRAKPAIKAHAQSFLSHERPGDFAQALMDLGATLCTPRSPDCGRCPLACNCAALRSGLQLNFPVKAQKPPRPQRRGAAFVLLHAERVLLRRRPAKGLLGGMSEFPSTPLGEDVEPSAAKAHAPFGAPWRPLGGVVHHVFTHFSLELTVFMAHAPVREKVRVAEGYRWANLTNLGEEGLPTLMRKVAVHAQLLHK